MSAGKKIEIGVDGLRSFKVAAGLGGKSRWAR